MLFRPEEVHRTSGEGHIVKPLGKGYGDMSDQSFGIGAKNLPIFVGYLDRFAAIETDRIQLNGFSRE